jgi:hypothetical protein
LYSQRKIVLMLAALLALAALVAGCGGGGSSSGSTSDTTSTESSDDTDSSGEAPTKAAFIKEGDKICTDDEAELNEEIEAFAKEKGISTSEEPSKAVQIELFHELVLPNIARQAEDLAALTPPEGDEATIEELTDTLSEEVAEAEEETGLPGEETLKGATDQARAYGFKSCGS